MFHILAQSTPPPSAPFPSSSPHSLHFSYTGIIPELWICELKAFTHASFPSLPLLSHPIPPSLSPLPSLILPADSYPTFASLFICNFLRETLLLSHLFFFLIENLFYAFLIAYVIFQNYKVRCVVSVWSAVPPYRMGTQQSCSPLYCQQLAHHLAHAGFSHAGWGLINISQCSPGISVSVWDSHFLSSQEVIVLGFAILESYKSLPESIDHVYLHL